MIVILLVLIGVGSFATILAWVVVPFIENKIKGVLMMVSTIENIQGHVVVFGVNAISLEIMKAYHANHRNILVVTQNHLHIKLLDTLKLNYILGDATCETIIKKSGAVDAQTILCSLEDDANNLLLLMMIQDVLRDRAHKKQAPAIIAMIQDPNNADKAQRNGATQVITPALLALDSLRDKKLI
jgi:voltage-gated potassium channel